MPEVALEKNGFNTNTNDKASEAATMGNSSYRDCPWEHFDKKRAQPARGSAKDERCVHCASPNNFEEH